MNLKITFYPGGIWEGGAALPPHLKRMEPLAAWIKAFLMEIKDLRRLYLSCLHNDGQIIGQEKANLVIEMDEVIGGLLLFRRYLTEGTPERLTAGDQRTFSYDIRIFDSSWTGKGRLSSDGELDNKSYASLHNEYILERIKQMLQEYGCAVSDRVITPEERRGLQEKNDALICDFLRIERRIIRSTAAL